jgi:hypothetical protein
MDSAVELLNQTHGIRTLYDVTTQSCHFERSEESQHETIRFTQGDNPGVPIFLWSDLD